MKTCETLKTYKVSFSDKSIAFANVSGGAENAKNLFVGREFVVDNGIVKGVSVIEATKKPKTAKQSVKKTGKINKNK